MLVAGALLAALLAPTVVHGQAGVDPTPTPPTLAVGTAAPVPEASVLAEPTVTPEPTPSASGTPTGTGSPSPTPTPTSSAPPVPTASPPPGLVPLPTRTPSAALLHASDTSREDKTLKLWEARHRCLAGANPMLSAGGFTVTPPPPRGPRFPFAWLIAAICVVVVIGAALLRHRLRRRAKPDAVPEHESDPLPWVELAAGIVAIVAGAWGLVVRIDPGLQQHAKPAKSAAMVVRTVNARIERAAFTKEEGAEPLSSPDRHEVGNVVWLELHLRGYRGIALYLQWATYESRPGGALVPWTARLLKLREPPEDDVDAFQPVWVGYPMLPRYRVQFRLLEDGQVRQIASTGPMDGDVPRYVCQSAWPKAK